MTFNYKEEQKKRRLGEARAELKKTLSGESDDAPIERISPEELEGARLKLVRENSSGKSYALRRARQRLKDTLSQKQIDDERL